MTNNSSNIQTGKEQNEATSQKKQDKNILTRAIKDFTERNLQGENGVDFYNKMKSNTGNYLKDENGIKRDFIDFISSNEDYDSISKKGLAYDLGQKVLREVVRFGVGFETKRKELLKLFTENYVNLTTDQIIKIEKEIQSQKLDTLDKLLFNNEKRSNFISKLFRNESNKPKEKDYLEFLENIKLDTTKLNKTQIEKIRAIYENPYQINGENISEILSLFTDLKQKQLLIKAFLPVISVEKLITLGVLNEDEFKAYIKKLIKDGLLEKFKINPETEESLIDNIKPQDIVIQTRILPETDVDKILLSSYGVEALAKEINSMKSDITKDISKDRLKLKLNKEGRVTPNFIKKVQENGALNEKIKGIEKLKDGVVFKTVFKDDNGKENIGYFRIDKLDNGTDSGSKTILLSNLTNSGGIYKNESNIFQEMITYDTFYKLLEKVENGEFIEKDVFKKSVESGEIKQEIKESEISTLDELNEKLNSIDEKGRQYKIEEGMSFTTSNSGKDGGVFGVFSITKIDKNSGKIWITNGQNEEGPFTLVEFFNGFQTQKGERIQSLKTTESFLNAIQNNTDENIKKGFKDLIVHNNKIIPQDRKDDSKFNGIEYLIGPDKKAIRILEIKNGQVKLSIGEYDEGKMEKNEETGKEEKGQDVYKQKSKENWMGLEMLYLLINNYKAGPKIPEKPVKEEIEKAGPKMKGGLFKSYLAGASVFDMVKGGKQFIDAIKHKLEQGSKIKASKFAYALGKSLHIPEEMLLDLKSSVEKANKSTIDEIMGEIENLGGLDRLKRITAILFNKGAQPYELQAILLVVLRKYGTLYPGTHEKYGLNQYRGSYLWYEKFGGKINDDFFMKTKKVLEKNGEQFTEEALLREYFKQPKVKEAFGFKELFWIDARSAWADGRNAQKETGDKDTKSLLTLDARINYAIDKMAGGEYYHVITSVKNIWSKGGSGVEMNKIPFMLLMSGITKKLSQDEVSDLRSSFVGGQSFPALWFVNSHDNIKLFQDVVTKLAKGKGDKMEEAIKSIVEKERKGDFSEDFIKEVSKFWDNYGTTLLPKLTLTKDPEIFLKKDESGFEEYKLYYDSLKGITTDREYKLKRDNPAIYNFDHSLMALTGIDEFLKKGVHINTNGRMNEDSSDMFEQVIKGLESIKQYKLNEQKDEQYRKKLFLEYVKGIYTFLAKESVDINKFLTTDTGKNLYRLGLNFKVLSNNIGSATSDLIHSGSFDSEIMEDFDGFMNGINKKKLEQAEVEKKSKKVTNIFEGKVENIIQKIDKNPKNPQPKEVVNNEIDEEDDDEFNSAVGYY